MTQSKLWNKLRKELLASPAKSATLAGGLLLAIVFWAPLAGKMFKPKTTAVNPPEVAAITEIMAIPTSPTIESMQALLNRIQARNNDERAASITIPTGARNPFVDVAGLVNAAPSPSPESVADELEGAEPQAEPEAMFVAPTGLVLSATLCGTSQRLAQINGRVYREGARVKTEQGEVWIQSIEPRRVVLERGEHRFELSYPKATTE